MNRIALVILLCGIFAGSVVTAAAQESGTVALVYYWKAKPGKLAEYNSYITKYAEPVDRDAKKRGAFISLTTYISSKPDSPWTHMRVFVFKDRKQLDDLSNQLDAALIRLEPDAAVRNKRSEYAATLRDSVGKEIVEILH